MFRAPLAVATVVLIISVSVAVAAAWAIVHEARVSANDEIRAARTITTAALSSSKSPADVLGLLESVPAVQSAKLYRPNGELVANYQRPIGTDTLANRIAPPEVTCDTTSAGTLCIESSPNAIAPAIRKALMLIAIAAALSLIIGAFAGHLLGRSMNARLRRIADIADKASREHAYSMRVDAAAGELGRMAASINELLAQMEERDVALRRRSIDLESANKDLEAFAYSVSHDLRAPLRSITGFAEALQLDYSPKLDATANEYLQWMREGCRQMRELIDGLLQMSRLARHEVQREAVDLTSIARGIAESLRQTNPERNVAFEIRDGLRTVGDERLLRAVLENLMANAWKFTRNRETGRIEVGVKDGAYYVRDNGAGFDPTHAAKMFRPFQRLHSTREFEGTGIGLATVQKIIERHGGRAWAEGEVEKGATIYFTTGEDDAVRT